MPRSSRRARAASWKPSALVSAATHVLLASVVATAPAAIAQDISPRGKQAGDLVIGVGAAGVFPGSGGSVTAVGGRPSVSDTAAPTLELVWFATPNIALASLAAPSRHAVSVRDSALGDVPLGRYWVASPNLAVQFHPWPAARVSPYIGAGATLFFARRDGGTRAPFVSDVAVSSAVGPLLNAGVDVELAPNWLLNLDARYANLRTDARLNGGQVRADIRLNTWVIGASLRYRF